LIAVQRGDGEAALRQAQLEPDSAYRHYLLALAHYTRGDHHAADVALDELIAKECFPKAEAAARRALQLEENLAEAHTSLGCVLVYYHLDFAQANTEYKRAIALNPNYATAHQWYADTILTGLSRFDEAIAEFKRALELDPLSLIVHTDFANTYRCARRTQEGLDILHRALEIDPNFYYAHRNYGQLYRV
jgi:tetratricopeptide (TPR) repeat protein